MQLVPSSSRDAPERCTVRIYALTTEILVGLDSLNRVEYLRQSPPTALKYSHPHRMVHAHFLQCSGWWFVLMVDLKVDG